MAASCMARSQGNGLSSDGERDIAVDQYLDAINHWAKDAMDKQDNGTVSDGCALNMY